MNSLGIYIHVPFCGKKCDYCDFYSVNYSKYTVNEYVNAVIRNILYYSNPKRVVDTIYFGGGTPSLLSIEQINSILLKLKDCFCVLPNAEITLEANPNTVNEEKLFHLNQIGINRLSLGIQSFVNEELKFLGRNHSAERAEKAVKDARSAGFNNISCDLMIGIPMQNIKTLEFSINMLNQLNVQHISAYILKTEKGTPFDCNEIQNLLPNEDETADIYLNMVRMLEERGFMQYEVSNFSKPGFESQHNCRYWNCSDYLGIGPSAHSCCFGKRFAVERDLNKFISSDIQQTYITDDSPCGFEETSMLQLRLKKGLDLSKTGEHRSNIEKKIPDLINAGYAEFNKQFLSLTPKGFLMSNSIIEYLIFE